MKITGIQKVSQHFLKVLLTSKGSDPFYPDRGTFMPTLITGSNIAIDNNAFLSDISDAVRDAAEQVRSIVDVNSIDPESALNTVEILGVDKIDEGWFLALGLSTLAGENAQIAVPFPEFGLGN
jgi:phage baseplate assembly protein W